MIDVFQKQPFLRLLLKRLVYIEGGVSLLLILGNSGSWGHRVCREPAGASADGF
jgi:hypothetical protein